MFYLKNSLLCCNEQSLSYRLKIWFCMFFLVKLRKWKERWTAFKWSGTMSLNLDGNIYLKPPQNYEFVTSAHSLLGCLGNAGASWGRFPTTNLLEKETTDSLLLYTLAEPGTTASRHWDRRGFSWPWSPQDNFWAHTAVLGTWVTQRGSALTVGHSLSLKFTVSNRSFGCTSGLGRFHFLWFYTGPTPCSCLLLENLKFSAMAAKILYYQRAQVASSRPSQGDVWVGTSQWVTMRRWPL